MEDQAGVSLRGEDVGPQLGNFYLPSSRGQGETEAGKGQESPLETTLTARSSRGQQGSLSSQFGLKNYSLVPLRGRPQLESRYLCAIRYREELQVRRALVPQGRG